MVQNIDSILQRGERLDTLVDKTDSLAGQAYAFRRGARSVRRQQWWKNTRITILSGFVGVVSSLSSTNRGVGAETAVSPIPLHCPILRRKSHTLQEQRQGNVKWDQGLYPYLHYYMVVFVPLHAICTMHHAAD